MFMTHVKFPAKSVISMRFWCDGALIEKAWQQFSEQADWEPCDPQILRIMGNAAGEVKVFEEALEWQLPQDLEKDSVDSTWDGMDFHGGEMI